MTPEQTFHQWDWAVPADLHPGEKAGQLRIQTASLAVHRRKNSGPAFVEFGPGSYRYWRDGRTRLEQLAYLRSVQPEGDAA